MPMSTFATPVIAPEGYVLTIAPAPSTSACKRGAKSNKTPWSNLPTPADHDCARPKIEPRHVKFKSDSRPHWYMKTVRPPLSVNEHVSVAQDSAEPS